MFALVAFIPIVPVPVIVPPVIGEVVAIDVTVPEPADDQDKTPLALVDNTWPAVPSAAGSVQITFESILSEALNPT